MALCTTQINLRMVKNHKPTKKTNRKFKQTLEINKEIKENE